MLDLSPAGSAEWEGCKKKYNDRIDRIESQIISKLRDRLGVSKTTNEMFTTFQKFNVLFFRPRIRGAIQEYQTTLLETIKGKSGFMFERFRLGLFSTQ